MKNEYSEYNESRCHSRTDNSSLEKDRKKKLKSQEESSGKKLSQKRTEKGTSCKAREKSCLGKF